MPGLHLGILLILLLGPVMAWASDGMPDPAASLGPHWWMWPILLLGVGLVIGLVAVMGGVGGGVLYVPIVSAFFPFHMDFVRGAGLLVALACALSASPSLLRSGMTNLRLTMPPALVASAAAILGARLGLALPPHVVQTALGLVILMVVLIMALARKSDFPVVLKPDALSARLRMHGVYHEISLGRDIHWQIHRAAVGLCLFAVIGFLAGLFGLGAGWANVPVLNLVMGAPLKVAAGSSMFILSIVDSTAAWVYLHQGAVLSLITVPSVIGMMFGSMIGTRLFQRAKPAAVRKMVLILLLCSGLRALLKGLEVWP